MILIDKNSGHFQNGYIFHALAHSRCDGGKLLSVATTAVVQADGSVFATYTPMAPPSAT